MEDRQVYLQVFSSKGNNVRTSTAIKHPTSPRQRHRMVLMRFFLNKFMVILLELHWWSSFGTWSSAVFSICDFDKSLLIPPTKTPLKIETSSLNISLKKSWNRHAILIKLRVKFRFDEFFENFQKLFVCKQSQCCLLRNWDMKILVNFAEK